MLRLVVFAFSVAVLVAGASVFLAGLRGPGVYLLFSGGILVLGTVFERWRYQKTSPRDARWESTGERFVDPQSGENVEVLYDPESGERRYASPPQEGGSG